MTQKEIIKKHDLQPHKLVETHENYQETITVFLDKNLSQKENNRLHLLRLLPYLQTDYRKLEVSELEKIETLKELFGDAETNLESLKVIFEYQNLL